MKSVIISGAEVDTRLTKEIPPVRAQQFLDGIGSDAHVSQNGGCIGLFGREQPGNPGIGIGLVGVQAEVMDFNQQQPDLLRRVVFSDVDTTSLSN